MSESEDSQASISSPSQKFIPQEDDEETLWEVIEITAEKGNTYKVRWKGNDPKTMKPWPQSWVHKSDCTDDLVIEWKRKQKEKQKRSTKGGRLSTVSRKTGRDSVSTVGKASTSKLPATPMSKGSRRSASTITAGEKAPASRLQKAKIKSGAVATPITISDAEIDVDEPPPPKPKGTKRKLADATSANSSARHIPEDIAVDININPDGKTPTQQIRGRPKKKRKVEVETVRPTPESEDEASYVPSDQVDSAPSPPVTHPLRKQIRRLTVDKDYKEALKQESEENEEEERMIEDTLSQASPPPIPDDDNFDDIYATDVPPSPPQVIKPAQTVESKPKDKGKGKEKQRDTSVTPTPPPSTSSPIKFGPPPKRRSLANKEKEKSKSKSKPISDDQSKTSATNNAQATKPSRASPLPTASDKKQPTLTEERSVAYYDFQYFEPILSPAALERLARFDEEVMGIPRNANRNSSSKVVEPTLKPDSKQQNDKEKSSRPHPTLNASGSKAEEKAKEVAKPPSEPIPQPSAAAAPAANTSKPLAKAKGNSDKSKSKPPSTATATSRTKSVPRRPPTPPAQTYNSDDVVPETDESQSQEVDIPSVQPLTTTAPKPPQSKSKSKSKSPPLAAEPSSPPKAKELRPIPVLSPSVFHPHLPTSSLPEDISEESSQPHRTSKITDEEDEAPMSSIEQFESPEKRPSKPAGVIMAPKRSGKAGSSSSGGRITRQSASDIWESDVVKRGVLIAEAAKRKHKQQQLSRSGSKDTIPPKKVTMDEIIAKTQSRSGSSNRSAQDVQRTASKPTPIPEVTEDEDVDMGHASTDVVPPTSGPRASIDDEGIAVQEMENAYVDLNGGMEETQDVDEPAPAAPPPVEPLFLREEEEESSQDILMDLQRAQQMQRPLDLKMLAGGWGADQPMDVLPAIPETTIPNDTKTDSSAVKPTDQAPSTKMIPEIVVEKAVPTEVPAAKDDQPPLRRSTRSRSRSVNTNPPLTRTNGKPKSTAGPPPLQPPPSSNGRVSPAPATSSNIKVLSDTARESQLAATIASLEAALAAERAKLVQQDATLKAAQSRSDEVLKQHDASSKQLLDLTARYQSEKDGWENEKLQLTVQLDSANKEKIMADKDREFFREQYAKASGFVSSVRDENKDLEKRIKIAEEQTQTGVNLVKATFDLRIKALEEDLRAWRRTAEFLIDKDVRTGNDEIRRRAAEEPELRALCQRQQALYAKAQERISVLEADLDEKRHDCADLETEVESLRAEATKLHVDLNEALFKLDQVGREGYDDESIDTTENGHEFVYSCKWRNEDEVCREVFSTISELEQHLVTRGGHLNSE